MSQQVEIVCKCGCGRKRLVRKADRDRGWGLFFNKSCKARHQEKRTGQYASYLQGSVRSEGFFQVGQEPWDDHKSY